MIKQIHNAHAHKRLNIQDWNQINYLERELQRRYRTYIRPEFYEYLNENGLFAIYKYNGEEIAKVTPVADENIRN